MPFAVLDVVRFVPLVTQSVSHRGIELKVLLDNNKEEVSAIICCLFHHLFTHCQGSTRSHLGCLVYRNQIVFHMQIPVSKWKRINPTEAAEQENREDPKSSQDGDKRI